MIVIKINIKGKEIELSLKEAEQLFQELAVLFQNKEEKYPYWPKLPEVTWCSEPRESMLSDKILWRNK